MFKLVKNLLTLLSKDQIKVLTRLQILVVFAACLETLSVLSIAPFMGAVIDLEVVEKIPYLTGIAVYLGIVEPKSIVILMGSLVVLLLTLSTIISMVTLWLLSLFGARFGMVLGDRLFTLYMTEDWLFHTTNNSSDLVKQISEDSLRVSDNLITPLLFINARLAVATLIITGMVLFDPVIALLGVSILVGAYSLIYFVLRLKLVANAKMVTQMSARRFRVMFEGFASVKDVILKSNHDFFVDKFTRAGSDLAKARGSNLALAITPRYLMELIIFGSLVLLIVFIINDGSSSLMDSLPALAFFGFAIFRLMPSLQQIYAGIAQIKGNEYAFTSIKDDLDRYHAKFDASDGTKPSGTFRPINLTDKVSLLNVSFKYPGKDEFALEEISLDISKGEIVGIVGESGSGKSTLGDLLLGLISPLSGKITINGKVIDEGGTENWRRHVGYVPQTVSLLDTSVLENVAFGVDEPQIDRSLVSAAIIAADLAVLMESSPLGLDAGVGEGGILLSGGQRQRVALARALYGNSELIVFDEATSALDASTQDRVMKSILKLKDSAAIVLITHSHANLKYCDKICLMSGGRLIDYGSAEYVIARNERF